MIQFAFIGFIFLAAHDKESNVIPCPCAFIVDSKTGVFDGNTKSVSPGDTICLKSGKWRNLKFRNISGAKENPLVIINYQGEAEIGNNDFYFGLIFDNCKYFKLTGTGVDTIKYGIKISGTQKGSGASLRLSSDFEIDHLEIYNTGFAGIAAKTDPTCDSVTWGKYFTMENILIHDNYIHNTTAEGMYIGNTRMHGITRTCDGEKKKVFPHEIKHIRVYNNIIENTGWDGLQVSMASEDCEIYSNYIHNFGISKTKSQDCGIVIGGSTTGRVYKNKIIDGSGIGLAIYGMGENYIYNNLIYGAGVDGIFIQDKQTVKPGWGFHILYNNIINPGRDGIRMYSDESSGNEFVNNIIINPGAFKTYETYTSVTGLDSYILIIRDRPIDYIASNNYFELDITKAKFVDPENLNFNLKEGSPAIDIGKDFPLYGIQNDYSDNSRIKGRCSDAGMYEYQFD